MSLLSQLLQKNDDKEHFLILCISDSKIQTSIVTFREEKLEFVCKGEAQLSDEDKLLEASDEAITKAEENLPEDVLVEKAIFVLPADYTKDDKVRPEKLDILKKLARELDLKPAGFVEYPQAISYYMEKKEGSPPTFLLLHMKKNELLISFVRIGKIHQNISAKRTENISSDFKSALPMLDADILPARIIIHDGTENLEKLREELLSFPWNKHPSFLHTPKIEIFPSDVILDAAIMASEASMIKHIHHEEQENTQPPQQSETLPQNPQAETVSEQPAESFTPVTADETGPDLSHDFGFKHDNISEEKNVIHKTDNIQLPKHTPFDEAEEEKSGKKFLPALPDLKNISLNFRFPGAKIVLPLLLLLTVPAIVFSAYYFLPKATVTVVVTPLSEKFKKELVLTEAELADAPENSLVIKKITEEVSGEKSATVTGKIRVGDRAKGTVAIVNKTTQPKKFSKGTILRLRDLQYTLDNETSVASSSETGDGLLFGKATADVTAVSIGEESNIMKDSAFTFKDFPENSFTAKSTVSFSGGSSREVSSVSKEDRTKLENSLFEELTKKAREQSLSKIEGGQNFIDSLTLREATTRKFTSETGSQADSLGLSMTVRLTFYTYENDRIMDLVKNFLSDKDGYKTDSGRTIVKLSDIKTDKNGKRTAGAEISIFLIPDINKDSLTDSLKGKTFDQASDILKNSGSISGLKIINEPALPFFGSRLPLRKENIVLFVSSI